MANYHALNKPVQQLCAVVCLHRALTLLILLVALAGCSTRDQPAAVVIPESTWRQIDSEIIAASRGATEQAANFAHNAMQEWMDLVYQRTETDFIPWFSSYWTRQWLTMKVSWYQLSAGGEKDPVVDRLALYLRKQYQVRVLEPVAKQLDPDQIMEQATRFYVRLVSVHLHEVPLRYGVPADQFDRRLQNIPVIALEPSTRHSASLYQVAHADPLDRLPAYQALIDHIQTTPSTGGAWSSDAGISSVARQTSERLTHELAASGVAGAASAMVGGVAGGLLSLGALGFTALLREGDRPAMEAQLRKNLNAAFDEEWLAWMRNPDTGVMAGVYYLSGHIEAGLASSARPPVELDIAPEKIEPGEDGTAGDAQPYPLWTQ